MTGPSPDQLPTARVPAILAPLPAPAAPQGPAYKTQPLRAVTPASTGAHDMRRARWAGALGRLRRVAANVPATIGTIGSRTWSATRVEQRLGVACVAIGVLVIVASLAAGWRDVSHGLGDAHGLGDGVAVLSNVGRENVSVLAALVLARTALAIAATAVGYGLLRVGERTLRAHRDFGGDRS